MRILYLSHYYPPEVNAPAVRVSGLARRWSSRGHRVTVVTGFPNHPTGVVAREYRGKFLMKEEQDGVRVLRCPILPAANRGFLRRIINYLSFMVSGTVAAIMASGKQDVVIATSPQFFVAIAGYLVSRIKRLPFVFEVRDVWPEEIVAVGAMERNSIIKLLERLELFLYRKAALIVAVAQGTIEILTARGVPARKIILAPNGVDLEAFKSIHDDHTVRDRYDLNGHFLVSYIGTHGMAHRLQTVLQAADRLRDNDDIKFLFVGDGADKQRLVELRDSLNLNNVVFAPQQQRREIPLYYAASDVCVVPLRRAALFTKNIPSKIYEIMASARPILIGTDGESRRLVTEADAGLPFEPDNYADLADRIQALAQNRELARRLGDNGRAYADRHFRDDIIAGDYFDELERVCQAG